MGKSPQCAYWDTSSLLSTIGRKSSFPIRQGSDEFGALTALRNRYSIVKKAKGSIVLKKKTKNHSPCADKTVIWENYKIGICQAGLDNKTGGTQRRLGAACFCTSKGCESPVFCAEKQGWRKGWNSYRLCAVLLWNSESLHSGYRSLGSAYICGQEKYPSKL